MCRIHGLRNNPRPLDVTLSLLQLKATHPPQNPHSLMHFHLGFVPAIEIEIQLV